MREFEIFLEKSLAGDLTLIDEFGSAQLAIQAAISQAFKTPEVVRLFAQKQPDQLRLRLAQLQRDVKIKQLSREQFNRQAVEILFALKKMGVQLSEEEQSFFEQQTAAGRMEQLQGGKLANQSSQEEILNRAQQQIKKAANE